MFGTFTSVLSAVGAQGPICLFVLLLLLLLLLLLNNNHDLTALLYKVVCKYMSLHDQIDSYKNTGGTPGSSLSPTRQSNAQCSNTLQ